MRHNKHEGACFGPSVMSKLWLCRLSVMVGFFCCLGVITGCKDDSETTALQANLSKKNTQIAAMKQELSKREKEVAALKGEVARLENVVAAAQGQITSLLESNSNLQIAFEEFNQPQKKFAEAEGAFKTGDFSGAIKIFREVAAQYPCSEYAQMSKQKEAEAVVAHENRLQEEKKKNDAQREGFKSVKETPVFATNSTQVKVKSAKKTNQWVTDRYDDYWIYYDADKDSSYFVLDADITSQDKNPKLPSLYVGIIAEDGTIRDIKQMAYSFYRWEDYGTYLGNYSDSRNDFEKRDTVSFTLGVQLKKEDIKGQTVIVFSDKQECFRRSHDRFSNPPVSYYPSCSAPSQAVTAVDFVEKYIAVKFFR